MRICGIEIKGSEAILCILSNEQGLMSVAPCRTQKFTVSDTASSDGLKAFQFAFAKLMEDYKVNTVVIKQRPNKGKFAGGVPGFKIEAAIQLINDLKVHIIAPTEIKDVLKRFPLAVDFMDLGLKKFQQDAFDSAYAFYNRRPVNDPE